MKRRFVGGESVKNRDNNRKQNSLSSNFRIPPELIGPTFPVPTGFTGIGITSFNRPTRPNIISHQEDYKARWGDGPDMDLKGARDTRISWANRCNWARRTAGPTRIESTTRRNWSDKDPQGVQGLQRSDLSNGSDWGTRYTRDTGITGAN